VIILPSARWNTEWVSLKPLYLDSWHGRRPTTSSYLPIPPKRRAYRLHDEPDALSKEFFSSEALGPFGGEN
jgi:hypothetical protein